MVLPLKGLIIYLGRQRIWRIHAGFGCGRCLEERKIQDKTEGKGLKGEVEKI